MATELTAEEKRLGEIARGFYIYDGGLPITLDYPWSQFPQGNYSRISLHRVPGGTGGMISTTEFRSGTEVRQQFYYPFYSPSERPATLDELWMFAQVAKFLSGSELIMSASRLEMIHSIVRWELMQQRTLIDFYLTQF